MDERCVDTLYCVLNHKLLITYELKKSIQELENKYRVEDEYTLEMAKKLENECELKMKSKMKRDHGYIHGVELVSCVGVGGNRFSTPYHKDLHIQKLKLRQVKDEISFLKIVLLPPIEQLRLTFRIRWLKKHIKTLMNEYIEECKSDEMSICYMSEVELSSGQTFYGVFQQQSENYKRIENELSIARSELRHLEIEFIASSIIRILEAPPDPSFWR